MIRLIAVVMVSAACACAAQTVDSGVGAKTVIWSPPDVGWWDDMPQPTIPKEMIGALRVANAPIVLEETNLEDARRRFGGTIGDRGDAGDALGWLCLDGSDRDSSWILWLTSSEIDGLAIGGFQWRRLSRNETPDRRCSRIPEDKSGIDLPIALHLGMKRNEVQKCLGRPTVIRGKTFFFCHEHHRVIRKQDFSVSNDVAITFRNGAVWEIEATKTTSD